MTNNTCLARVRLALIFGAAVILQTNSIDAATGQSTGKFTTEDGRPVYSAVEDLEHRYGYAITYEDPYRVYHEDLVDITEQVRKDLDKYPPGKAPKVIGPNDAAFTLDLPDSPTITTQQMAAVLQQVVQAQARSKGGGHFRVAQVGSVFHVIPTEVRDRNGNWATVTPILDTLISLPMANRTKDATLFAIAHAVSVAAHAKLDINSGFGGIRVANPPTFSLGADNEPARDVLARALTLINPNTKWTWTMFCAVPDGEYHMSVEYFPL